MHTKNTNLNINKKSETKFCLVSDFLLFIRKTFSILLTFSIKYAILILDKTSILHIK